MNTDGTVSSRQLRGRPKSLVKRDGVSKEKINATIRIEREYWEALDGKARSMGMNRTQLLREIALGYIQGQKALKTEEKEILGKSLAS
jgi:predicted DNA-binding ribbon-helix-helix protein